MKCTLQKLKRNEDYYKRQISGESDEIIAREWLKLKIGNYKFRYNYQEMCKECLRVHQVIAVIFKYHKSN